MEKQRVYGQHDFVDLVLLESSGNQDAQNAAEAEDSQSVIRFPHDQQKGKDEITEAFVPFFQ